MERNELEALKIDQLKQLAKDNGLKITSTKKDDIIDEILAAMESQEAPEEDNDLESQEAPEEDDDLESQEAPEEDDDLESQEAPGEGNQDAGAEEECEAYDDTTKIKMVYVGPNLPDGLLTTGRTLWGTEKSIMEYVEPALKKFPKVRALLVTQENASRARNDIRIGRGIYYKYFNDLTEEAKKRRNGK